MNALVVGEALADIVDSGEQSAVYPGGSPLNVAVGLARLGVATTLHTAIGDDPYGRMIGAHLRASGVTLSDASRTGGATSTAEARIGADGSASYRFEIEWAPRPFDTAGFELVHTGSIGAALAPGAAHVLAGLASASARPTTLVSFDPNVRPALMGEQPAAQALAERFIALADIVKASDEDVAWLYPGADAEGVLRRWCALGARLAVITRGGAGAIALDAPAGAPIEVAAPATTVVDTIGAGDSFMSGLLAAVLEHGFDDTRALVTFAARCAAITVSRAGAKPPTRAEVDAN